jgi:cell division septal protein FtsQ
LKYLLSINPFIINNTIITGNTFLNNEEITNIVNKNLENKNIINVNFKKIKENIEKNNFVYETKVYTQLPASIIIEVEEISPLALLEKDKTIYFIDQGLNLINASSESINFYTDIPVITNLTNNPINLNKTINILTQIIDSSEKIYKKLNEIRFLDNEINLFLNNNTYVILANDEYKNSLMKFFEFNNQVIEQKNTTIEKYEYINVSIPHQITTILNEQKI